MRRYATRWLPLREASAFIARHHRHHDPAPGGIVALGIWEDGNLIGVGIIGRPVSRVLQAQGVCEVTRTCVLPDHRHACSCLLGALRRVAQSLGFRRMVTYSLPQEGGASLRAAGWAQDALLPEGRVWDTPSLRRNPPTYPVARKIRWWRQVARQGELRW